MKKLNALLLGVLVSSSVFAQTKWTKDPAHTNLTFAVSHMTVSETTGTFTDYTIDVTSPSEDFNNADVTFNAKAASVNTGNERRDGHLKSPDFFDAEKYPDIKFVGKLIKDGGKYHLRGKLTMKDVTKDIDFDVTYKGTLKTTQMTKAGFKFVGMVNRFDYNLKFDGKLEGGGLVVGQEVEITANVELNLAK
jgi:polyisoprenoid-binding protein YceI